MLSSASQKTGIPIAIAVTFASIFSGCESNLKQSLAEWQKNYNEIQSIQNTALTLREQERTESYSFSTKAILGKFAKLKLSEPIAVKTFWGAEYKVGTFSFSYVTKPGYVLWSVQPDTFAQPPEQPVVTRKDKGTGLYIEFMKDGKPVRILDYGLSTIASVDFAVVDGQGKEGRLLDYKEFVQLQIESHYARQEALNVLSQLEKAKQAGSGKNQSLRHDPIFDKAKDITLASLRQKEHHAQQLPKINRARSLIGQR